MRQQVHLADQFAGAQSIAAVQEGQALVVAGAVGKQHSPTRREARADGVQPADILPDLLQRDQVERRNHLGHQGVVGVAPIMCTEVGDVPSRNRQPRFRSARHAARGAMAAQDADLVVNVEAVGKVGLWEFRHAD